MIPTGMMRIKMGFTRRAVASIDDVGQATLSPSSTTLNTVVGFVESNDRYDDKLNSGLGANEKTHIVVPWFSGLKNGDQVTLTDGSITTLYQIESIEDDRNKHRQLRLVIVRAEEGR
jgi:transcription antitermination factor NusG